MKSTTIALIAAVISVAACDMLDTLSTSDFEQRHAVANGLGGSASRKELQPIIDFYAAVNKMGLSKVLVETDLDIYLGKAGLVVAVGEIGESTYLSGTERVGVTYPDKMIES